MMLNTKLRRTSLVVLAVVLMLSVFTMTAFAEETEAVYEADVLVGEGLTAEDGVSVKEEDLEVGSSIADDAADEVVTTTGTETTDDGHDHDHDHEEEATDDGFTTSDLVLLIIFGVVVIAAAVVCVIKREQVVKFLRSLKSEFKKIVWSPWNQVRKNTIVVIVVVIVLAVVIGLLDFLFGNGIAELKSLINPA